MIKNRYLEKPKRKAKGKNRYLGKIEKNIKRKNRYLEKIEKNNKRKKQVPGNKTISDGGITVDFSIIKVHTSN